MIASGVFLVATLLVPKGNLKTILFLFDIIIYSNKNTSFQVEILFLGMDWLTITFVMIAKFAITSSYGAIYVFTAEQFPTVVRNVGLGASSTFARIGGVIAPYINHLVSLIIRNLTKMTEYKGH